MPGVLFNNARGDASSLQMAPPFAFSDVTMSVFPLRASLPTLQNFCRNYLNQAPNMVQFQPFVPFVYLVLLDYGRMSLEAANMGWVSQREVAFGIPLRWLNAGPEGLQFHDWAFSSPFIFVDNELSMSTGREVYGWPKLLARLDPSVSEWVQDPHGARRVFQVSTKGANKAYAGETSTYRPLLSVFQHRTAGLLDVPPSLDAAVRPLSQMSNAVTGLSRLGVDLTKTFVGMASDRINGSAVLPDLLDQETLKAQLTPEKLKSWTDAKTWLPGMKDALWSMFPRMYANTINFKQFRDAANPHATCYQALTAARMPVSAVKQGGFLGPQNMMLGQLDGGFRIDVHNVAGLPIIESLGLEVTEEREADGTRVSTLTPLAPLWMKVDMTYGVADTLVWRGRSGGWNEGALLSGIKEKERLRRAREHKPVDPENACVAPQSAPPKAAKGPGDVSKEPHIDLPEELDDGQGFDYIRAMNFFNTARGASEAVGGSFSVPDASVRVLPLKADSETLRKFVRAYLRVEDCMRFEAWGDFVYLVISDFKQMNSELSSIAKRRARELSLLVPVKCYDWFGDGAYPENLDPAHTQTDAAMRAKRGREKLLTTGFVNAFTYVDDVETAITANEVFGVPSMGSSIQASENEWLSRDYGAKVDQHEILRMNAQVLPELMVGAQAVERTLVEVSTQHFHHAGVQESEDESVSRWVGILADDLEAKQAENCTLQGAQASPQDVATQKQAVHAGQGFALKLLGGALPLNQFALKQFRDSHNTLDACYQGIVLRRHKIERLSDFREIDAPVHVSITDYPTQPITAILGLKPKFSYPGPDGIVRVFESLRPFSLNADLHRGAGVTLFERIGSQDWDRVDITEEMFGWRKLGEDQVFPMIQSVGSNDQVELAYDYRSPKTDMLIEKRLKKVRRSFLDSWYQNRVQKGRVSNIRVRQRERAAGVSVIATEKSLQKFRPAKDLDIAAWNAQMQDQENSFQQTQMAAAMECFSPATVLDKVLSRNWGHAKGSTFPRFNKPDFCVPVSSVPNKFAPILFPDNERHENYWPQSRTEFEFDRSKREGEATAFKFELNAAIHMIAVLYPGALAQPQAGKSEGDWSVEAAITGLSEKLNTGLDEDDTLAAQMAARRAIEGIKGENDIEGMMHAAEDIVVQFIDAHLPDVFRVDVETVRRGAFQRFMKGRANPVDLAIGAQNWKALFDALNIVQSKIQSSLGGNVQNEQEILEHLAPYIKRARANWLDMRQLEASLGTDQSSEPEPVLAPHADLRKRLKAVMTKGINPAAN